jgi:hypothetical protein
MLMAEHIYGDAVAALARVMGDESPVQRRQFIAARDASMVTMSSPECATGQRQAAVDPPVADQDRTCAAWQRSRSFLGP